MYTFVNYFSLEKFPCWDSNHRSSSLEIHTVASGLNFKWFICTSFRFPALIICIVMVSCSISVCFKCTCACFWTSKCLVLDAIHTYIQRPLLLSLSHIMQNTSKRVFRLQRRLASPYLLPNVCTLVWSFIPGFVYSFIPRYEILPRNETSILIGCDIFLPLYEWNFVVFIKWVNNETTYQGMKQGTYVGMEQHTWVWNNTPGYETTHLGMKQHTWVWNNTPGYETTYMGMKQLSVKQNTLVWNNTPWY
jgi:hypothetical protein